MPLIAADCPHCGAPIAKAGGGLVYCEYCATPLTWTQDGFQVTESYDSQDLTHPEQERCWLGGHRYRVEGRMAQGEISDVFLAHRDHRLTERVLIKRPRVDSAQDLLDAEWDTVSELQKSKAQGYPHFSRLLPLPRARGMARLGVKGELGERYVHVYALPGGFVHSGLDIKAHYPQGIPPAALVWIFKRTLELLSFMHESGYAHGSVVPRHILVHARDHGVRFCGFSSCVALGSSPAAFPAKDTEFCPSITAAGDPLTPLHDLITAARTMLWLAGSSAISAPTNLPAPLADLLTQAAQGSAPPTTAWEMREALSQASRAVFGEPKFVPFSMPGWNIPAQH